MDPDDQGIVLFQLHLDALGQGFPAQQLAQTVGKGPGADHADHAHAFHGGQTGQVGDNVLADIYNAQLGYDIFTHYCTSLQSKGKRLHQGAL